MGQVLTPLQTKYIYNIRNVNSGHTLDQLKIIPINLKAIAIRDQTNYPAVLKPS